MVGPCAVNQLARRLKWLCGLRGAVWWGTVALVIWGSAVVICRLIWAPEMTVLFSGGLLVILAAIAGGLWAARQVPGEDQLLALLDAENACGGLLVSDREVPLNGWKDLVHVRRIPAVSWRHRKALGLFALAMVYVGLALFLPQRVLRLAQAGSRAAEREVERLQRQLEKLREMQFVEEQRFHELEAKLQEVRVNATATEPGKTQEALDHLEQVLKQLAMEGLQKRQDERELLLKAQELAKAIEEWTKSDQLKPQQAKAASQALEKLLQEAREMGLADDRAKALEDFLNQHDPATAFNEEELRELAKLLEKLLDGQNLQLQELAELGLVDPELLEMLKREPMDLQKLRLLLAEWGKMCGTEDEGEDCAAALLALLAPGKNRGDKDRQHPGLPGRGGTDRGRADAELTFGQASSAEGVQLRPEVLKPGALHRLDAPLLEVKRVKPGTSPRETSQGGALGNGQGTGEAHERQILPRHRNAVRKYFESRP